MPRSWKVQGAFISVGVDQNGDFSLIKRFFKQIGSGKRRYGQFKFKILFVVNQFGV